MAKLISIGEALIDRICYPDGRVMQLPGGAPANVAVAVRKLGQDAMLITKVGEDAEGKLILDTLAPFNLHQNSLLTTNTHNTTIAEVTVAKDGQRTFQFDRRNAADLFITSEELPRDVFHKNDIYHFGSVDLVPSLTKEATLEGKRYAQEHDLILSFDPNLRFALWPNETMLRDTVLEHMVGVDILKISDEELPFLFPNTSEKDTIKTIFQQKIRVLIYSKGAKGVSLYTDQGFEFHLPAYPKKVLDTTGAGDGLLGAFLSQLLAGNVTKDTLSHNATLLIEALKFANAAAAIVCTRPGAIPAFPHVEEVQQWIKEIEK